MDPVDGPSLVIALWGVLLMLVASSPPQFGKAVAIVLISFLVLRGIRRWWRVASMKED